MSKPSPDNQGNAYTRRFGPRLCDYCNEFLSVWESVLESESESESKSTISLAPCSELGESDYHPTLHSLHNAVESGCQLCIMIGHQIRREYSILDEEELYSSKKLNSDWGQGNDQDNRSMLELQVTALSPGTITISMYRGSIIVSITGDLDSRFAYPGTSGRERVVKETTCMKKHHALNYAPPDSTDNPAAWKLCRSWIENCIENHERCKRFHTATWWPTRLLYIGGLSDGDLGDENLSSLNIQLHLTEEKRPKGRYMTLSYCWGDSGTMLKLTRKNIDEWMKTGIPYTELPKTFQDAVRLSLFLGNDYLWIDSLCIIQRPNRPKTSIPATIVPSGPSAAAKAVKDEAEADDAAAKDDWTRESKTMADVYRHSKCNIAATASQGPTEGCFYSRNPSVISPLQITFRIGEIPCEERYLFLNENIWKENVEGAPLNSRAWVMQERILAPRQIHCGREQLLWECHETIACETFPFIFEFHEEFTEIGAGYTEISGLSLSLTLLDMSELRFPKTRHDQYPSCHICCNDIDRHCGLWCGGFGVKSIVPGIVETLGRLKEATRDEWIAHTRHHIYQGWVELVREYSDYALSHRTDKLIAISGIASRIQDVLEDMDDYVAGLWRSQLPWQLLWSTSQRYPDNTNPRYDIGPSWSWASINTSVHWNLPLFPNQESEETLVIDILDVDDGHTLNGTKKESPLKLRCLLYKLCQAGPLKSVAGDAFAGSIDLGNSYPTFEWENVMMDSIKNRELWEQAYMMPITYDRDGIFTGLVVSPCKGRPKFYRRIAKWCDGPTVGGADLFEHVQGATDEDKETITLI
ncbi:hypothetical protein F4677DRAFT_223159 [Hypoxylon crocopeplum]|nr:hypothetical protein F4677DRAFT_223159 [Hypoxylon crocopeplum]